MIPFARGERVALAVGDAVPSPKPHEAAWLTFDPEPAPQTREVHFLLHDGGARAGVASLAPIRWETHDARIALHALPGVAVDEALALLTRYAFDELNLDTLWAEAARPEAEALLASAGWRRAGGRRWARGR